MKMMRSTRVMSTSGVTLIPVIESPSACDEPPAMGGLLSVVPVGVPGLGARARPGALLVPRRFGAAAGSGGDRLEVREQQVAERLGVCDRAADDALGRIEGRAG